jgi:hypothetical protein
MTGPVVIGATGGSGTRVFARIVRRAGLYIGTNLNESEDALDLAYYADRWINTFLAQRDDELDERMAADLDEVLAVHRAEHDGGAWGWKEPRSIYLLPFLDTRLPGLRFVHIVRDGRDMALSSNQNQLRKHADALLGPPRAEESAPLRSIMLWGRINNAAADYGAAVLGDRYLRLRFEDLCGDPVPTIRRLHDFLGLDGDAEDLKREVAPPPSLGRWRTEDVELRAALERAAGEALQRFGYVRMAA